MHVGRQVSDALEQSIDKAQKDKKIKFDRRDKKIYFTIAFVVTVYFAMCWIVTFTTEPISLPDFILICAMAAIYPLMVLVPALWIRFLDVCLYLRRLERYGYEVPEDSRTYDKMLEKLPRKESVVQKRKINDGMINTSISAVITVGILCYCIWYGQKYQCEPFYFFNYIGLSIWGIVTLRYALQISNKKYKADLELDDTRKTRESVMEALMGMLLLMVFSLVAIACILAFTKVAMKSVTTEIQDASTEEKNDYEDETRISQLITVGDLDIDIYQADTLLYFYHPNEESGCQEGADFVFSPSGTLGDQKVMTGSFGNQQTYTMVLMSNVEQIIQIGIYNQGDDYVSALSDLQMKKGDVVRIEYSKEDSKVYLNDSEMDFKKEGNKDIGTQ